MTSVPDFVVLRKLFLLGAWRQGGDLVAFEVGRLPDWWVDLCETLFITGRRRGKWDEVESGEGWKDGRMSRCDVQQTTRIGNGDCWGDLIRLF